MKCTSIKLVQHTGSKPRLKSGAKASPGTFGLILGNPEGTLVTVTGTDAAGDLIDISTLATLSVTPSDPTIATATVSGMSYTITTLKAGHVDFALTATWNDGSAGPFNAVDPCDVAPGAVTGLVVIHGNPS